MALNKSTGNMYAFVSHTYNPLKGECEHSCAYCFMRRKLLLPPLHLELKELKVNLGEGNFIFVGSSTDEWAANVPSEWIEQVLDYCDGFNNRYLFQSKNPARFLEYLDHPVMKKSVLCTTIETNRFYPDIMRNTPVPQERAAAMQEIANYGIPTYVTCEPLMQFDPAELVARVKSHLNRYERLTKNGEPQNGTEGREKDVIKIDGIEIHTRSWKVFRDGEEIRFPNREFELLKFLAMNPNIVFSKEELFEKIWGYDYVGDSVTVTVHINRIREKIEEDSKNPKIIETVWGAGYRLNR